MAASIPKEIIEKWKSESATKVENDFECDLWTADSGNRIILRELVEHMKKEGKPVDPAFLHPEEYRFPEEKKDGK